MSMLQNVVTSLLIIAAATPVHGQPRAMSRPSAATPAPFTIDWRMEPRFGRDENKNGYIDLPNTPDYANADSLGLAIILNGPKLPNPQNLPLASMRNVGQLIRDAGPAWQFEWTITPRPGTVAGQAPAAVARVTTGPSIGLTLPQGTYDVSVHDLGPGPRTTTGTVVVRDLLIVSIGDSYSSGEGNPEARGPGGDTHGCDWADDGRQAANYPSPVKIDHIRSHRSTLSWPAQIALACERRDPHTSVTFLSFAASGATIGCGLLGCYGGVGGSGFRKPDDCSQGAMRAQLDQLKAAVGGRTVDLLTMSIGINDIGFSQIITAMLINGIQNLTRGDCGEDITTVGIEAAAHSGKFARFEGKEGRCVNAGEFIGDIGGGDGQLRWHDVVGLDYLPTSYDMLAERIKALGVSVKAACIAEYPSVTRRSKNGASVPCEKMLTEVKSYPEMEIGPKEIAVLERLTVALDDCVANAAKRHGWKVIGGVRAAFERYHGMCEGDPYPPTAYRNHTYGEVASPTQVAGVRWVRRAKESCAIQGPDDPARTRGTLHPNELGHRRVMELFFEQHGNLLR